jgi:hypothetical protein
MDLHVPVGVEEMVKEFSNFKFKNVVIGTPRSG